MKALAVILTTAISLASIPANGNEIYGKPIPIVTPAKTVTRNVPVLAKSPRIPKFKVLRSNPHRYAKIVIDDVDYEVDDEGLMSPYRREDLGKIQHEDGLSDYVRWRLFLARQLALLKYRVVHGVV